MKKLFLEFQSNDNDGLVYIDLGSIVCFYENGKGGTKIILSNGGHVNVKENRVKVIEVLGNGLKILSE